MDQRLGELDLDTPGGAAFGKQEEQQVLSGKEEPT